MRLAQCFSLPKTFPFANISFAVKCQIIQSQLHQVVYTPTFVSYRLFFHWYCWLHLDDIQCLGKLNPAGRSSESAPALRALGPFALPWETAGHAAQYQQSIIQIRITKQHAVTVVREGFRCPAPVLQLDSEYLEGKDMFKLRRKLDGIRREARLHCR